jgi:N-acetylglucosaminyldiphosphoundecaprenol N-acetyl-beta-D-mannosaminyltransferase
VKKSQTPGHSNDIDRDVYCLLGLAIDAVNIKEAVSLLRTATLHNEPYLMSTPNVNFLINSQRNVEFREAVLNSDLCVADGMPLIWIARLLGVPLPERVAGSDIFEKLKQNDTRFQHPLSVFFFGGEAGVGEKACDNLNSQSGNVTCAGSLEPGFGSVEDMSRDEYISTINDSGATFLVVALGAVKGHIWLERNIDKLRIPLRSHLGAVINFEAGGVARSPGVVSRFGFEWLWRIKEEPKLWRRYWSDGLDLITIMFTRVLPLAGWNLTMRHLLKKRGAQFSITREMNKDRTNVYLSGYAGHESLNDIRKCFRYVANSGLNATIDFTNLSYMSSSALGTLMMLRKQLKQKNVSLRITGASSSIRRLFKWHGLEFMLVDNMLPNGG